MLEQGRSQPHSPGWARVPLSSFFPQISIKFFLKLYLFSSSFWPSGWASRPPGKALATPLCWSGGLRGVFSSISLLSLPLNCDTNINNLLSPKGSVSGLSFSFLHITCVSYLSLSSDIAFPNIFVAQFLPAM